MAFEIHQSFMIGYVRRINAATLNVTIGGVRIGEAKYSRLAQINLKSRIITFSRFAIENVPERGRRYLVIHELAHVKEPDHSPAFWKLVAKYEPNYKEVGRELDKAFHRNVRAGLQEVRLNISKQPHLLRSDIDELLNADPDRIISGGCFEGTNDDFGAWSEAHEGIVYGGVELA
jgi:hypothetical protein